MSGSAVLFSGMAMLILLTCIVAAALGKEPIAVRR